MKKFKSYSFWTALAGAVTLLLNSLGECFGFSVNNEIVSNIIMAIAGVLVVFGVVTMPKKEEKVENDKTNKETIEESDNHGESEEN